MASYREMTRRTLPRPPIGIMPRWLWAEQNPNPTSTQLWNRRCELEAAIARYNVPVDGTQFELPEEWLEEWERLLP